MRAEADPERFRIARETSFGRRHLSSWTKNPILIWIVSPILPSLSFLPTLLLFFNFLICLEKMLTLKINIRI